MWQSERQGRWAFYAAMVSGRRSNGERAEWRKRRAARIQGRTRNHIGHIGQALAVCSGAPCHVLPHRCRWRSHSSCFDGRTEESAEWPSASIGFGASLWGWSLASTWLRAQPASCQWASFRGGVKNGQVAPTGRASSKQKKIRQGASSAVTWFRPPVSTQFGDRLTPLGRRVTTLCTPPGNRPTSRNGDRQVENQ